jgi:diacylglycerol kinase (ATP)
MIRRKEPTVSKTLVIYNPVSGRGLAAKHRQEVENGLRALGVEFDIAPTRAALHAVQLAADAVADGYDRVITAGGDGLVHEVINGLLRASNEAETVPLGIIPLGSGNDFNKMTPPVCGIGETHDDWRAALGRIAKGETSCFDVGRISGDSPLPGQPHPVYFHNGMDVGFGALVARHAREVPSVLQGTSMYLASVIMTLANYQVPRLKIQLDDGTRIEQSSTMTAIANGRCFGGGFWIAPNASANDAHFEVMVANGLGRVGILGLVPRVMKGTHITHPAVKMMRASRVIIDSPDPLVVEADGELPFMAAHHLEIELLPGRLRLIV